MRFLELGVRNFLTYAEETISLDSQGLVLMRGVNLDSSVAISNGAGKSALLVDAWTWILWGRSPRYSTLPGDKVIRRAAKEEGCVGWLTFEDGGRVYCTTRYQGHPEESNSLYFGIVESDVKPPWTKSSGDKAKSDKSITQAAINRALGLSYETALNAMVLGSSGISFAGMTDAQKKGTLEDVLEFDRLTTAEKRARAKATELQGQIDGISPSLMSTQSSRKEMESRLDSLTIQEVDWLARRQAERERQQQLLERQRVELNTGEAHLATLAVTESALDQKMLRVNADYLAAYRGYAQQQSQETSLQTHIASARVEVLTLANNPIPEVCNACGQPILAENVESAKIAKEERLLSLREGLTVEEKKLESLQGEMRTNYLQLIDLEKENKQRGEQWSELHRTKPILLANLKSLRGNITALEEFLVKAEDNPFSIAIANVKSDILRLGREIATLEVQKTNLEKRQKLYEFWAKGFGKKGLQSYLLDSVIPFLNERCVAKTQVLFGGEVEIEFRTQKLLADGKTFREEFHVTCVNRFGSDIYEGNSDGERDRADICVALALQDLVLSRVGRQFNLCILDEATHHTDERGVEVFYQLLELLTKERSTVFVITHSPALESLFDTVWTTQKQGGVSKLLRSR